MLNVPRSPERPVRSFGGVAGGRDGQILALFALFLIVLIAFAAVAVDLGSWLKVRRDYQNAADSAALAGAPFLAGTPDRDAARLAAWQNLAAQLGVSIPCANALTPCADTPAGTPVAVGPYEMWVSTPPIGASGVTQAKYPGASTGSADKSIFVWVQAINPSFLARVVGISGSLVGAWATAGLFPSDFAVITLRQPAQAGPAQADINLAGQNVKLRVVNGDVGGNYNMKLNSSTDLILPGDSQVYLHDYVSCGQSCWGNIQINDGSGNLKTARQLPGPVPDPNYPLPPEVIGGPTAPTASLPYGYVGNPADKKSSSGHVKVGSGGDAPAGSSVTTVSGKRTCDGSNAVRIGPGYYEEITIAGDYCVILDPTFTHNCISGPPTCTDSPTPIAQSRHPGIFYVNGSIDVGAGSMLVGDGVTIVLRPTNTSPDKNLFTVSGGAGSPAIVSLNRGDSPDATVAQRSGAWTRTGARPYVWNTTSGVCRYGQASCWTYTNSYESSPGQWGIALYVMRRDQIAGLSPAPDDNTNIVSAGGGNSALVWDGVTYAPRDNVTFAGQPGYDGVGQLVSWTFTFNGGTDVTQTYPGAVSGIPLLIEPKLGQN